MPSGRTHTTATLLTSFALAATAAYLVASTNQPHWAALPIGAITGLLITPDLDVDNGSISHAHARNIGCLFGLLWSLYWTPYARIMSHRGASHWPVVGTLVRLVYAFWWLPFVWWDWGWVIAFAVGLVVVDCLHIMMDGVKTLVKSM